MLRTDLAFPRTAVELFNSVNIAESVLGSNRGGKGLVSFSFSGMMELHGPKAGIQ